VGAGLLLVYNVLAYALKQTGLRLALRANPAWARRHLDEAGAAETTLAIQTLRNTVLVATFVGTLVFGQAVLALNTVGLGTPPQEKARVVLQAALQVAAFLSFASVIRTAQHIGYLLGGVHELQKSVGAARKAAAAPADAAAAGAAAPPPCAATAAAATAAAAAEGQTNADDEESAAEVEDGVLNLVRTQAWAFSLGFRFLYCSLPFAFGVAGAAILIVAAVLILGFLVYIDHAHEPCCLACAGGGSRRAARNRRGAATTSAALLHGATPQPLAP
jgi:hypothetical protein